MPLQPGGRLIGSQGPYSHGEFIRVESPFLTTHGDKNGFAFIQKSPYTHRQSHFSSKGQRKDRQDSHLWQKGNQAKSATPGLTYWQLKWVTLWIRSPLELCWTRLSESTVGSFSYFLGLTHNRNSYPEIPSLQSLVLLRWSTPDQLQPLRCGTDEASHSPPCCSGYRGESVYLRRPEAVSSSLSLAVFPAVWSLSLSIKRSPVVSKEEKKTTCEKKMTALVALSPLCHYWGSWLSQLPSL